MTNAELPLENQKNLSLQNISAPETSKTVGLARSIVFRFFQSICIVVLAYASYFVISHYFVQSVKVVGMSMVPTLADSQHYLLNKWIYYIRSPKPREVIVLRDPSDNGFSVKRVVAVGGDTVLLSNGSVFVNGKLLQEPYLVPGTPTYTNLRFKDQIITCAKDQYFVLGDNRLNSIDSRTYGPVPRQNVLGLIVR